MGKVEEVRWKMKMGWRNNKEEIGGEVGRLSVSSVAERKNRNGTTEETSHLSETSLSVIPRVQLWHFL